MIQDLVSKYLQKLVAFKTISGIEYQDEVLKLYKWYLNNILISGFSKRIFENNGFNSLIIEPSIKRSGPQVVLLAHIDVVPAPNEMFVMTQKDGRFYGRGVSDMKVAPAIFLYLMNKASVFLSKNIKIVLTSDEEIGSSNGVKALLEAGELNADVVILPDGGDDFKLVTASKGFIHIEVRATGKGAHGSRPWEGINAIDKLFRGYNKLQKEFNNFSNGNWTNTMSLGCVYGGEVVNSIPDKARFNLDFRYTEKSTHKSILKQVKDGFGPGVNYVVTGQGDNFKLDTKKKFVKQMINQIKKTTGKPVELINEHGGSDARFFTKHDIPVLLVKPKAGDHHTQNEWVDIDSLKLYTNMLIEYLELI